MRVAAPGFFRTIQAVQFQRFDHLLAISTQAKPQSLFHPDEISAMLQFLRQVNRSHISLSYEGIIAFPSISSRGTRTADIVIKLNDFDPLSTVSVAMRARLCNGTVSSANLFSPARIVTFRESIEVTISDLRPFSRFDGQVPGAIPFRATSGLVDASSAGPLAMLYRSQQQGRSLVAITQIPLISPDVRRFPFPVSLTGRSLPRFVIDEIRVFCSRSWLDPQI
jgi:hypothetical protein